jgi:hypothetical protein
MDVSTATYTGMCNHNILSTDQDFSWEEMWKIFVSKKIVELLKPHCIQSSQVLVPAGTIKSTLRRHGI